MRFATDNIMNILEYRSALAHFEQVTRQYIEQSNDDSKIVELFRFFVWDAFKVDPMFKTDGKDTIRRSEAKHCLRAMLANYTNLSKNTIGKMTCVKDHSAVSTSIQRHYQLLSSEAYAAKAEIVENKVKNYINN